MDRSAWFYCENTKNGRADIAQGQIDLPMAALNFPRELYAPPKHWAEAG
jgi:hypothetical protein